MQTLFVFLSTYDIVVGALLVCSFITIAPKIFRLILPEFHARKGISVDTMKLLKRQNRLKTIRYVQERYNASLLKHLVCQWQFSQLPED